LPAGLGPRKGNRHFWNPSPRFGALPRTVFNDVLRLFSLVRCHPERRFTAGAIVCFFGHVVYSGYTVSMCQTYISQIERNTFPCQTLNGHSQPILHMITV
ncbi:hypothetical protein COCCADRAFT_87529, partial [Bipolaris zeicola 26-R-13]